MLALCFLSNCCWLTWDVNKSFLCGSFSPASCFPCFNSVWLFAINKTVRYNRNTKIVVCLYTDCLSLAKGTAEKFTSAQYEIKNLEIYVTVGRERKKKRGGGRLTHLKEKKRGEINAFIMFSWTWLANLHCLLKTPCWNKRIFGDQKHRKWTQELPALY